MGAVTKIFVAVLLILGVFVYWKINRVPSKPDLPQNTWWGPGKPKILDESLRPFKIDVDKEIIEDLYKRLNNTLPLQPSLEGVNHHYGINSQLLQEIVDYWKTQYNWPKRQEFLNQYPHFKTKIQGLDIHFMHVKPKKVSEGVEVLPLLISHGWPGSFREFYEMIPLLTTQQKGKNFVFEVIAPSIPGYAFSEGASKPGLAVAQVAEIFNRLMLRLGYKKYYAQGGDWGSVITRNLAVLYPENIRAVHMNWCFTKNVLHWKSYVGTIFPSLFFTQKEIDHIFPLSKSWSEFLLETGYMHIQATKPDTVGVALRESPVGLAAYMLEKFIAWTNKDWIDLPDGGLTRKFTYDQLLDNVMIYWVTKCMMTSQRLYAESFSKKYQALQIEELLVEVPSGCNRFKNEISFSPETIIREGHANLIHLTDYEDGGHFTAFELPQVLGRDIIDFVEKVRSLEGQKSKKEL